MADIVVERYHFGSGVTLGSSKPVQSALGLPAPVQAIHSSVLTSMIPPKVGLAGFTMREGLALGGGGILDLRRGEEVELVGLESPALPSVL